MKIPLVFPLLIFLLMIAGCSTMEKQTPELIRSREPVLFEGTATLGSIMNNEKMIGWNGTYPVTVTPTTLFFGTNLLSFSVIESAEVTSFDDAGFGIFLGPKTYEELLIIKTRRSLGFPCYNSGCVFIFRLDKRQAVEADPSPTQGELARQVAGLINSHRALLDPFGRRNGPRKVWLSVGVPWFYHHWAREPFYLMEKFPEKRKAVDELFKAASRLRSESFKHTLESYASGYDKENGYTFEPLSEAVSKIRGYGYPPDIQNALKNHQPVLDSALVVTGAHSRIEEKVSPYGEISIKLSMFIDLNFCDLNPPKAGESHSVTYEISLPLQEWLDGGIALIDQALEDAAIMTASEIKELLKPVPKGR